MSMVPVYITGWLVIGASIFSMAQCTMAQDAGRQELKALLVKQCHDEGFAWETSWDGWCDRNRPLPNPTDPQ